MSPVNKVTLFLHFCRTNISQLYISTFDDHVRSADPRRRSLQGEDSEEGWETGQHYWRYNSGVHANYGQTLVKRYPWKSCVFGQLS
jgi:hypothetical protein